MRTSRWLLISGGVVVVAAGAAAAAFAVSGPAGQPSGTPAPTSQASSTSPTPSPTPTPVELPQSAPATGNIVSWKEAVSTQVARVLPQVGDAASGVVSAYVDAPVVDDDVTVLEVAAEVDPGVMYDFSAQVRSMTPLPEPVAVTVEVGDTAIDVPDLDAAWSEISGSFLASRGEEQTTIRVVVNAPVRGLGIDAVVLAPADGGASVVPNGSFEHIETDQFVLNRSLILPADRPVLAVKLPQGEAVWRATDSAGEVAASGTVELEGTIDSIELDGLPQGYFTVEVEAGDESVSLQAGVIDYDGVAIEADQRFGVGLHVENGLYAGAGDLAASLGIGLARNDVLWRDNETTKGQYDFADHYVDGFSRLHVQGIHLLGIVNYGNWLYGNGQVAETPAAIAAYGRYAAAIADRFDLVGLEVYNEFNHARFNSAACGTGPTCYLPLLETVHDEVRAVDPDLPIIAGGTARYDADWFDGLWQADGLDYSDAVSFHPYEVSSDPESLFDIIDQANASMTDNAGDTRPIWITELGSSSKTGGRTVSAQADYLVRTAVTALSSGAEKFFWYDLINDDPDPAKHEGNFGMYYQKAAGVAAFQPKPVGYAQALMIAQLGGRSFTASESVGDGIESHQFGDADDSVRIVWAPAGEAKMTIRTDSAVTLTTMTGATRTVQPSNGVVEFAVGERPQFVKSSDASDDPTATPSPTASPTPAE